MPDEARRPRPLRARTPVPPRVPPRRSSNASPAPRDSRRPPPGMPTARKPSWGAPRDTPSGPARRRARRRGTPHARSRARRGSESSRGRWSDTPPRPRRRPVPPRATCRPRARSRRPLTRTPRRRVRPRPRSSFASRAPWRQLPPRIVMPIARPSTPAPRTRTWTRSPRRRPRPSAWPRVPRRPRRWPSRPWQRRVRWPNPDPPCRCPTGTASRQTAVERTRASR